jgi:hypothetical protein
MDDFFLHFERSGLPMHIGSFAIFDPSSSAEGPPDLAQIRESIGHGVRRTPVLRQRLGAAPLHIDRPYWTFARDFDLDDHVRSISLSGPATWQRLCSEVARLFQEPLDLARPLFEVTVIENLDGVADLPSGAFALTRVQRSKQQSPTARCLRSRSPLRAACCCGPGCTSSTGASSRPGWQRGLCSSSRGARADR